jgi:hypothetical protein
VLSRYGVSTVFTSFSSTGYLQGSVEFTTGVCNTIAKVYVYNPSGDPLALYKDNLQLV